MINHLPMPEFTPRCFFRVWPRSFYLALALGAAVLPAVADEARPVPIDIAAQTLEQALEDFAAQTRRQVTVDSAAIDGIESPAVRGTFSPEAALRRLVADSGLSIVEINDTDFALRVDASAIPQAAAGEIEEVYVLGENLSRTLLNTATSINVQTEADIVRSNDKRITDVFLRAANVNTTALGPGLQPGGFSIRGINSGGVGNAGSAPTAAVTVDGSAFTGLQLGRGFNSLFDVQQVEMLRGPQSTSQARNSLAGGVVISTNDPEFEQRTQLIAAYGNYDTYEVGVANTGAITDELAYRITLQRLSTDGFMENPTLGDDAYSFSETDTVRAKLLYRSQNLPLEILLGQTFTRAEARNDTGTWFPDEQQFVNGNPYGDGGMESDQDVTSLRITYDLTDQLSIQSQTAYNDFVSEDLNSNYATSLPDRNQAWFATADQDEFNQTFSVLYEGPRVRGSAGLFYSEETNIVLRDGVAQPNLFGSGLDGDTEINNPSKTETRAIYGEFDIVLTDTLTLTLGGRYESIDLTNESTTLANLILPPPAPYTIIVPALVDTAIDASTSFSEFLPRLGMTYALRENQRLGFTYSEGYRQGGVSIDSITLQTNEFEPEFVRNYEVSYKGAFSRGLSLNTALFYLDWQDQQVNDTVPGEIFPRILNAGSSTVYGAEIELFWRSNQWDSYATFGYVKSEFDEFSTNGNDFAGNAFPGAPEITAAVGAFYSFGSLTVGAEANYQDGVFTQANNQFETESLTLVDLSADYRVGDATVRAFVNNAFDEIVRVNDVFFVEDIPIVQLTAPRTYGVQVMYGF